MGLNDQEGPRLNDQRPEMRMTDDRLISERIERTPNSFNNIQEENKESRSAIVAGRHDDPCNQLVGSEQQSVMLSNSLAIN